MKYLATILFFSFYYSSYCNCTLNVSCKFQIEKELSKTDTIPIIEVGHEEIDIEEDPEEVISNAGNRIREEKVKPVILYKGTFISDIDGYIYSNNLVMKIISDTPVALSLPDGSEVRFESLDSLYQNTYALNLSDHQKNNGFTINQKAEIDHRETIIKAKEISYAESVLSSIDKSFIHISEDDISYNERKIQMKSFEISRFEVSKEQYRLYAMKIKKIDNDLLARVISRTSKTQSRVTKSNIDWTYNQEGLVSQAESDWEYPVSFVTWAEAKAFCNWLSDLDAKYNYRLPYAYEWDYVASNAFRNTYPWDNEVFGKDIAEHANLADKSRDAMFDSKIASMSLTSEKWNDGDPFLSPVGKRKPNAMGMHNMAGNVAEWLENTSRNNENHKLIRGGSYFTNVSTAKVYRSDEKYSHYPSDRRHHAIGIRLVRTLK